MKKRLGFFITTLNTGGAERVLAHLLSWLDSEKFEIYLLTVSGGENAGMIPSYVHRRCLLKDGRFSGILQRVLLKLPDKLFASLFMKGDFDYEIAYMEGKPTAYVLSKKTNAKKIAFVHCDLSVNQLDLPLYNDRNRCLNAYRQFDAVCFVSNDALCGFEKSYGKLDNGRVIHNVIDTARVVKGSSEHVDKEYHTKGLKLVTVGRLAEEKNYGMLVSVIASLSPKYDMELWIIGDGEKRGSLTEMIEANGLDNVHLLGFKENPYPYVKKADLYVCSSSFEGYSTSVLESVILGIPVLTTDCAGMSELLKDGRYGMIVENSQEALLNGITATMRSRQGRRTCRFWDSSVS